MSDTLDEDISAVFEEAQENLSGQLFHSSVMVKIELERKFARILNLIQAGTIVGLLLVLLQFFGDRLEAIVMQSLNRLVEGPWLLAIMIFVIALCLVPLKSE